MENIDLESIKDNLESKMEINLNQIKQAISCNNLILAEELISDGKKEYNNEPRIWEQDGFLKLIQENFSGTEKAWIKASELRYPYRKQLRSNSTKRPNCSLSRLKHDIEQMEYLIKNKIIEKDFISTLSTFKKVYKYLSKTNLNKDDVFSIDPDLMDILDDYYNKSINIYRPKQIESGAINRSLNFKKISEIYFNSKPNVTYIDNFLTDEALFKLRRMCYESTFWFDTKVSGYIGTYARHGFCCGLLFQIVRELKEFLPNIFEGHTLSEMWGYKYDSEGVGIATHADPAAINLNLWITPDEANLNNDSGGLIVFDKKPLSHWDHHTFNRDQKTIKGYLNEFELKPVRIPYKSNRMAIFDSSLFHHTEPFKFKDGYLNRRTNITFLFGEKS